jgi:hypothetical protein
MKPDFSASTESDPSTAREYFDELRTYPGKWDFSEFKRSAQSTTNGHSTDARPASEAGAPTGDGYADWKPEAFPQPRTMPTKWDLSSLT